jgi:hypothetical protein
LVSNLPFYDFGIWFWNCTNGVWCFLLFFWQRYHHLHGCWRSWVWLPFSSTS